MPGLRKRGKPAPRRKTAIRKDDTVLVLAGRSRGRRGRVLEVDRKRGKVLVEGANVVKKHVRPNPQKQIKGGIADRHAPLDLSNVKKVGD